MIGSMEERLRQALAQHAGTTTASPDGWGQIRAAIDGGGRARRRWPVPWTVLAPAAAVVLAVVLLATLVDGGGDRTLRVTGDSGRLYLAPTGVEPRFQLDQATDGPTPSSEPSWMFRAFGRRAADGFAVEASVVIIMPSDRALGGTTPEPAPLRALDRDVAVARDPFGQRILSWTQTDGRTVGVMTFGLSQSELTAVAESLLPADAATAVPALPSRFTPIGSGAVDGAPRVTLQSWHAADGARFSLEVAEDAQAVDNLAWWLPGSRALKVRNTTAAYLVLDEAYLAWIERPGTLVMLQAKGLSEQDLVAIAAGLQRIGDAAWRDLKTRVPPPPPAVTGPDVGRPPGRVTSPNSYLVMVPVRGRTAPPCAPVPPNVVVAEGRAGREVACYQVGNPFLNADDIYTSILDKDGATGQWTLHYTLTSLGVAHMEALFREVGAGGQFAILVDGALVSAPRFDGPPAATGVVTGLDEQTARGLADRLGR